MHIERYIRRLRASSPSPPYALLMHVDYTYIGNNSSSWTHRSFSLSLSLYYSYYFSLAQLGTSINSATPVRSRPVQRDTSLLPSIHTCVHILNTVYIYIHPSSTAIYLTLSPEELSRPWALFPLCHTHTHAERLDSSLKVGLILYTLFLFFF